ncbi:hypothetical protein ACFV4M_14230 [Kitasatospora indigofera]|uniref:hypothetical protein n=1 Tax=Kitasatospora indigofera TaxID=67307 RepID=UPI00364D35D8
MDSSFAEVVRQSPASPAPPCGGLPRRAVLLGGAGALLGAAGCAGGGAAGHSPAPGTPAPDGTGPGAAGSPPAGSRPAASPSTVGGTPAALPAVTPWVPGPGEVDPDVKLRAVQLVEALGNWPAGGQGVAAAGARAAALGLDPGLAGQAGPLLPAADRAALQVLYAQYGGLLGDSASVMVVCRQWTAAADGTVAEGGTTVDVRLGRAQPRWTVTELHPADPGPPSATLSAAARAVLTDTRILLPPAALADVTSGAVHDSVLRAMLTLARTYTFQVTVLRSGHPLDVFGTDRPSDHPQGRGVDVWQIDGHTVADPATDHALVDGFMRAAAAAGSYNVGGPRQLSGGVTANQFFSDDTHHDHVHAGFTD